MTLSSYRGKSPANQDRLARRAVARGGARADRDHGPLENALKPGWSAVRQVNGIAGQRRDRQPRAAQVTRSADKPCELRAGGRAPVGGRGCPWRRRRGREPCHTVCPCGGRRDSAVSPAARQFSPCLGHGRSNTPAATSAAGTPRGSVWRESRTCVLTSPRSRSRTPDT